MPSVGFEGAWGQQNLADAIRQRMIDALSQKQIEHGMSVEDQKLALEKQRYEQEAADRALLRSQQGQAFNETLAEKTGANLGAGPSIISPQFAERFKNTSLAPLITPDKTLPSTSLAAAAPMVGETGGTAPTVTENAPTLTGQLRFAGLPALNKQAADEATISQMANDPNTPAAIRGFLRVRQALPKGENIDYHLITEPNGPQKNITDANYMLNGKPVVGLKNSQGRIFVQGQDVTDKVTPYVPPAQPAVAITDNGIFGINRGNLTGSPITDASTGQPLQPKLGETLQARVKSAQTVAQVGNELIDKLRDPAIAAKLGPAMSRYDTAADFFGNPPPEFSFLKGAMESYALANMGVHGMRSNNGAEAIKATLGLGRLSPENIIQTILGLNSFATDFMKNNGVQPVGSHDTVGPPTPANAGWRVLPRRQ